MLAVAVGAVVLQTDAGTARHGAVDVPGQVRSRWSIAVEHGAVVAADNSVVAMVDNDPDPQLSLFGAWTAGERWRVDIGGSDVAAYRIELADEVVVVGMSEGDRHVVRGYDRRDGRIRWQRDDVDLGIVNGAVVVWDAGAETSGFEALDASTGRTRVSVPGDSGTWGEQYVVQREGDTASVYDGRTFELLVDAVSVPSEADAIGDVGGHVAYAVGDRVTVLDDDGEVDWSVHVDVGVVKRITGGADGVALVGGANETVAVGCGGEPTWRAHGEVYDSFRRGDDVFATLVSQTAVTLVDGSSGREIFQQPHAREGFIWDAADDGVLVVGPSGVGVWDFEGRQRWFVDVDDDRLQVANDVALYVDVDPTNTSIERLELLS